MDVNEAISALEAQIAEEEKSDSTGLDAELKSLIKQTNLLPPDPEVKEDQRGFLKRTADWFKGGQRDSTIPTIAEMALGNTAQKLALDGRQATQLAALISTTASDDRLRRGIKKILPDANFTNDEYGNLVVISPVTGKGTPKDSQYVRFYPNPKGLDKTDLFPLTAAAGGGAVLAGGAALLGIPAGGYFGSALLGMAEGGLAELISSRLTGSVYKIFDIPLSGLGGVLGKAGMDKAAQLLTGIVSKLKTKPFSVIDKTTGNLKKSVQDDLRSNGIDPDGISEKLAQQINEASSRSVDGQAVAATTEAQSLPVPVPLTKGQASGNPSDQLMEDAITKGVYGESNKTKIDDILTKQTDRINENVSFIEESLGGGAPKPSTIEVGENIQSTLNNIRRTEKRRATDLFTEAGEKGYAFIPTQHAGEVSDILRKSVDSFPKSEIENVSKLIDDMDEILSSGGDIKSLFDIRRQLNGFQKGSPSQAAATRLKNTLDSVLDGLVEQKLLDGNPEAVAAQMKAIANYRDYASRWKDKGILRTLTEVEPNSGSLQLKKDPAEIANFLFNSSGTKLIKQPKLRNDLRILKAELPEAAWNQIRQEAFATIVRQANMPQTGTAQIKLSGVKMSNFLFKMTQENPEVMRGLFSADEIKLMKRFASVARRVTDTTKNASNSAYAAAGILSQLYRALDMSRMGRLVSSVPFLNTIQRFVAGEAAEEASPQMFRRPSVGAAIGGAVGGSEEFDPMQKRAAELGGNRIPQAYY